ncbi:hypothetical protein CPC735_023700 [Coccidioides posadasii C735 delta SOWgp]|uniref:Uncharacterized protein n=1 Tax=Coccidioides posadasii (strain C735) TaxID=222929 RepID=C5P6I4_COCP7|nr:hypothetical protein CPC735_023700 [Coccidioides posadasii C735 delta SOWgp]EER27034.1 hypothetical protein CPC735_023700 [Coccidioides posadasii C735 delta SOWgp]|eukprot:XP_003069179.1 hypothetical protein CPC735_023700 [Coccidioides posadasii C735 delta SOWgp]
MDQATFDLSASPTQAFIAPAPDMHLLDGSNKPEQLSLDKTVEEASSIKQDSQLESDTKHSHFDVAFDEILSSHLGFGHNNGIMDGIGNRDSLESIPEPSYMDFEQYDAAQSRAFLHDSSSSGCGTLGDAWACHSTTVTPLDPTVQDPELLSCFGSTQKIEANTSDSGPQAVSHTAVDVPATELMDTSTASTQAITEGQVADTPDTEGTGILLRFKSAAEANAYAPQKWPTPLNDPTIPQSQEGREAIVRELMEAMYCLTESKDNDGMVRPWREGRYSHHRVEISCWNVLVRPLVVNIFYVGPPLTLFQEACVERHETGPLRYLWDNKDNSRPDSIATFEERIAIITKILKRVEQNKGLNAKKGMVIKAGKSALEKEERETGKALLPAPKGRHKKSNSSATEPLTPPELSRPVKRQKRAPVRTPSLANVSTGVATNVALDPYLNNPLPGLKLETPSSSTSSAFGYTQASNRSTMQFSTSIKADPHVDILQFNDNSHATHCNEYGVGLSRVMETYRPSAYATPISDLSQSSSPSVNNLRAQGNHAFGAHSGSFPMQGIQPPHFITVGAQTPHVSTCNIQTHEYHSSVVPTSNIQKSLIHQQGIHSSNFPTPEIQVPNASVSEFANQVGVLSEPSFQQQAPLPMPHDYHFPALCDLQDAQSFGFAEPIQVPTATRP